MRGSQRTVDKRIPKELRRPNTTAANRAINQLEFLAITCNLFKSARKITRTRCDWFYFCLSLVVFAPKANKSSDNLCGLCEFGWYFSRLARLHGHIVCYVCALNKLAIDSYSSLLICLPGVAGLRESLIANATGKLYHSLSLVLFTDRHLQLTAVHIY